VSALDDVAFVESEIEKLLTKIQRQIDDLKPDTFSQNTQIGGGFFGHGERAPRLTYHYDGAQQATYERLVQAKRDLMAFQAACIQARNVITEADRQSADDMTVLQNAVVALSRGSQPYRTGDR
jgi:hypothetical protein